MLVLGGSGLLGHAVAAELARRGAAFDAPARAAFDLWDLAAIPARLAALCPAAVLHLAGFTDVAGAEDPDHGPAVVRLNAEAPAVLAEACAQAAIPFAHVSTDYVFDGRKRTPYREDDGVNPLQVYGLSKLDGERAVLALEPRALVIRVATLFGPGRPRRPAYVDAILAQARARAAHGGGVLEVVEPPVASPTYAPDAAPALLDLMRLGASGIVHVANEGGASRLELARATVELGGLSDRVEVRPRPDLPGALARPPYSVLDTGKLERLLGRRLPPWRDALARYIDGLRVGER